MQNPLLIPFDTVHQTPPFHIIEESHYVPAFKTAIEQARNEINSIKDNKSVASFKNTILALDLAGKTLTDISNIFFNLNHAHTNANLQQIAREVTPWLTEYSNDIWLNQQLFNKVEFVRQNTTYCTLNPDEAKLLDDTFKAFVRKGALLNETEKERYRQITTQLSKLSLQFGENILAETNDFKLHITNPNDLDGLPDSVIEAALAAAKGFNMDGWVFTLHFPSYVPFMKYAKNRELRKQMFMAYSARANRGNEHDNNQIVLQIAALRHEKAQLLGFETHADYVLQERMAQSANKVNAFLNDLLIAALPFAKNDLNEVAELAQQMGLKDTLQRWDFTFYSEILKNQKYSVDDELIKPYFKLENVEKGIFDLANQLFGITFSPSSTIPTYHTDVKAFEVFDGDGTFLSILYLDYFPRPTKQNGAWMTSYRDQFNVDDCDVRPIVSLVMNFSAPTETSPSLLTFNEVHTILHEFGHALHGMLSKVRFPSQSGTNVYRDFVELPSQWFENWATDKQWLQATALHYQTNEVIPDNLIEKIIASENYQSGYATIRQLGFGLVDMAWHSLKGQLPSNVLSFEQQAMASTDLFPKVEGICTSTSFSHIFDGGYGAGYYGYKWAEVLDADAFELFKETGTYNKQTALSFRQNILEKGGSAHPMELYLAFRGKEPSINALLKRCGLV